jgi:hypothetical protein
MPAVLYKCPVNLQHVSAWVAEEADRPASADAWGDAIMCAACSRVHLIHPKTGKVFGVHD